MGWKRMFSRKKLPPFPHDFWLEEMEQARGDAEALIVPHQYEGKLKYLFFPGCQLGASDPRYPQAVYQLLCQVEPATAMWLSCCGAPSYWVGEIEQYRAVQNALHQQWEQLGKPTLVLACMSCKKIIDYVLPDVQPVTVYEILAAADDLELPIYEGMPELALADPCMARDETAVRKAVCTLLERMRVPYHILHEDMHTLPCCGFGGNIEGPNLAAAQAAAKAHISSEPRPYLAYCVNCRDVFAGAGKKSLHILDLVTGLNGLERPTPHLSLRRDNRRLAKALALGKEKEECLGIKLVMDDEVAQMMDDSLISADHVRRLIARAEQSGMKFIDEAGINIAHLPLCGVTIWAEYRPLGERTYQLLSVYFHRMERVEGPPTDGERVSGE